MWIDLIGKFGWIAKNCSKFFDRIHHSIYEHSFENDPESQYDNRLMTFPPRKEDLVLNHFRLRTPFTTCSNPDQRIVFVIDLGLQDLSAHCTHPNSLLKPMDPQRLTHFTLFLCSFSSPDSSRCASRGDPGGPGPPLTLGFEAPKLSIFGPYLIFP